MYARIVRYIYCLVIMSAFLLSASALAAQPQAGTKQRVPTTITSNRMEYDATAQTVLFLGDVHVKRPDFELWSEKMTVYLDNSGKKETEASQNIGGMEGGEIDRIVAEKNVRLKSENNTGTCDKATYYAKEDKFVMEGRPVLRDNKQSMVSGKSIIHYLSANRSQVVGGAVGTFYSEDHTEPGGTSSPTSALPGVGAKQKGSK